MRIGACLLGGLVVLAGACGKRPPLDAPADAGGTSGAVGGAGWTVGGTGGTAGAAGGTGGGAAGTGSASGTAGAAGATAGAGGTGGMAGGAGSGTGGSAGGAAATGGGAGGRGGGGGTVTALCDAWTGDFAAQNLNAIAQHGFFESKAILEGTLGDRFDQAGTSWARFTIGKVRAGVTSHEGREVAIQMGPGLHAAFGAGASLLVGMSSTYPYTQAMVSLPIWSNLVAVAPLNQTGLPDDVLGFRAWHAADVAVIRVRALPAERIEFDVVETLAGSIPATFNSLNWPSAFGPIPVRVGDERLAGFAVGSELVELRPNSAEERARALRGIAALAPGGFVPLYRGELDAARADAATYRLAWTVGRADRVLGLEVAGIAAECCTNAGGEYFANNVTDVLRGDPPAGPVVTGGHGVYAEDRCGDRFLSVMRVVNTVPAGMLAVYTCAATPIGLTNSPSSGVDARLPDTPANRADVNLWLRSAPPLLRLYPAGVTAPAGAFSPPPAPAVWSVPVPALTAILARHQLALLTVVDAQPQPGGGHAVRLRTPLYVRELATLTNRDATLYVPCADPRLLKIGSRWIGALMGAEPFFGTATTELGTQLDQQKLMLVPGFLLPEEREDLVRTADALTKVAIPRPLGP